MPIDALNLPMLGIICQFNKIQRQNMPISLDRTDLRILAELQRDGRLTNQELAERVSLSPSPCLRRVRQLEQAGVTFLERDVHAKVLVCDDWVIVSSFNFLSFAGYYDMHRRARHELGIRVVGGRFADDIVGHIDTARTR